MVVRSFHTSDVSHHLRHTNCLLLHSIGHAIWPGCLAARLSLELRKERSIYLQ